LVLFVLDFTIPRVALIASTVIVHYVGTAAAVLTGISADNRRKLVVAIIGFGIVFSSCDAVHALERVSYLRLQAIRSIERAPRQERSSAKTITPGQ
jgi:hypothetical protein